MRRDSPSSSGQGGPSSFAGRTTRVSSARLTVPGATPEVAVSVGALLESMRGVVEGAVAPLWVRGEVIGYREHRNGHWYFNLRDASCSLRCVAWASDVARIKAAPEDGVAVVAYGYPTVYPARGELQFRVLQLEGVGDGLLQRALERARQRLEKDGLLDPQRKRKLPKLPRCVAVVTSADGAAFKDILVTIRRRAPGTDVVLVPATVQGDGARDSLCAALRRVADWGGADVVILGRGGGAREDLWVFNDEAVARAAAAVPVPLIAAIGHEIDTTLCDLVADRRAPTPTAAAELAVPSCVDLLRELRRTADTLGSKAAVLLGKARQQAGYWAREMNRSGGAFVRERRHFMERLAARLDALSPLAVLARGFTVVTAPDGTPLVSVGGVAPGDRVMIQWSDGRAEADIVAVSRRGDRGGGTP
jgi:exodeoxyribonuclease VII large subunit